MLIDTAIKTNDVVSIKLITGDEIIARIVDNEGMTTIVTKPLLIAIGRDPKTGQPGISMAPLWMLGADIEQRFPILKSNIVCMVKSNTNAAKGYIENITGLSLPSSNGLIT